MTATGSQRPLRRLHAWLVTGPAGHLYGALADLLTALMRGARSRCRTTRRAPRP